MAHTLDFSSRGQGELLLRKGMQMANRLFKGDVLSEARNAYGNLVTILLGIGDLLSALLVAQPGNQANRAKVVSAWREQTEELRTPVEK